MERRKPPVKIKMIRTKTKKMVRTKTADIPKGTKFLWCPKDGQFQHYLICKKKCKDSEGCTALMKFLSGGKE